MKLHQESVDHIIEWSMRFPHVEVCGMVADSGRVIPMKNESSQPDTQYQWGVEEMRAQFWEMDKRHEEPVAFYHSHPSGKPDPSEVDMIGALNAGMIYLIAYQGDAGWTLSAWLCLEPGILVGEPLDVVS